VATTQDQGRRKSAEFASGKAGSREGDMGKQPQHGIPPAAEGVAANGLLHRRMLFSSGAAAAGAALAGGGDALAASNPGQASPPSMLAPGAPFRGYGMPAKAEEAVQRGIPRPFGDLAPGTGPSNTPLHRLEGIVTPNGLHFERHHNGVPNIDPGAHRLLVHGLVERPLTFGVETCCATR
jgi:sulfane dehydrogenase subunit SoxC